MEFIGLVSVAVWCAGLVYILIAFFLHLKDNYKFYEFNSWIIFSSLVFLLFLILYLSIDLLIQMTYQYYF